MSNQKGCGKKVATVKAVWMGSEEIGTSAIQVDASESTSVSIIDRQVLLVLVPVVRVRLAAGRVW
jgi:hypothetical protein